MHKTISRSDPRYYDPGAVQARIDKWNKLLEFESFELDENDHIKIYEKTDLLKCGYTVVRPVLITSLKNYGTNDETFQARLAADGRTVERDISLFGPPMDLITKRCIDFVSRNTSIRSRTRRKIFFK